jgi:hypothetical protein
MLRKTAANTIARPALASLEASSIFPLQTLPDNAKRDWPFQNREKVEIRQFKEASSESLVFRHQHSLFLVAYHFDIVGNTEPRLSGAFGLRITPNPSNRRFTSTLRRLSARAATKVDRQQNIAVERTNTFAPYPESLYSKYCYH